MILGLLSKSRRLSWLAAIFLLSVSPSFCQESLGSQELDLAGYPQPTDDYVNDYAQVLTPGDVESLRSKFRKLEEQTGIEAVVVTIQSIHGYGTNDLNIESFATNLFNKWGIGKKKSNNGILILVSTEDRKIRIELGGGYPERYDSVMKQVIDERMIPYFKSDEYSKGITEGASGVMEAVTKKGFLVRILQMAHSDCDPDYCMSFRGFRLHEAGKERMGMGSFCCRWCAAFFPV